MSTITKRLTVDQYDQMVENGILPETNRFELINGRIVEKVLKNPAHSVVVEQARRVIQRVLPAGWDTRQEQPVRIPKRRSEPEPDVAVVRGAFTDYLHDHPGPDKVALVVEVTRSRVANDQALARVYGAGGIPAYWIINVPSAQLEVYEGPTGGKYPARKILGESDSVSLIIDGQVAGQIAVADLLPKQP